MVTQWGRELGFMDQRGKDERGGGGLVPVLIPLRRVAIRISRTSLSFRALPTYLNQV